MLCNYCSKKRSVLSHAWFLITGQVQGPDLGTFGLGIFLQPPPCYVLMPQPQYPLAATCSVFATATCLASMYSFAMTSVLSLHISTIIFPSKFISHQYTHQCNHGNDYYSSHTVLYIGCTGWEYNFSVVLPFGLGGSLCILGTAYINWEVTAAGSILAHGKAGCGTVGMDTVSCKGVDPWGSLYEHSYFGNPQGNFSVSVSSP